MNWSDVITRIALVSAMISLVFAGKARSADVPWDRVPNIKISDFKKDFVERVTQKLGQVKSYGRCTESVLNCLKKDPPHSTAARLARDVLMLMAAESSDDEIGKWIEARKNMAHPKVEDVRGVNLEGLTPLGDPKAAVVIVEYSDFQCPYCATISPVIEKVVRESGGKARLYFKQFPIKGHPRSVPAAIACVAADRQGKFWEFCPKLFENQSDLTDEKIAALAKASGLDMTRFKKDLAADSTLDRIADEKMEGLRNRITGTPTIYINGKEFLLKPTGLLLRDRIAEELDILNGKD